VTALRDIQHVYDDPWVFFSVTWSLVKAAWDAIWGPVWRPLLRPTRVARWPGSGTSQWNQVDLQQRWTELADLKPVHSSNL
jgi:hypothetical protein